MKVRHSDRSGEKVQLQMTPMIDIVFQLLVFFIMTFKIVSPEGDFNIRMPLGAPSEGMPDDELQIPPIKVRLTATGTGHLAGVQMNERDMGSGGRAFQRLRSAVVEFVRPATGPGIGDAAEVEIDADYGLQFEYVMDAITAVSGQVEGDRVIPLVEKIKFAPPRPGP